LGFSDLFVVTQAVNAFVFLRIGCAFLKLVASYAKGAGLFSSAVASCVVKFRAFISTGCKHKALCFADLPSKFYLLVQKQILI